MDTRETIDKEKRKVIEDWPRIRQTVPKLPELAYPDDDLDFEALWCRPDIHETAWVSPGSDVIGRVRLKARSSVWYGCVLRGDQEYIEVGEETNVQDKSILHIEPGSPCVLGDRVTLGHMVTVHASLVEDEAMIGIGATVLSRCTIGRGALVAAGALVLEGTNVPEGTLWAGVPARQIKVLTPEQKARMAKTYRHYADLGALYIERFGRKHIELLQA
jgi:carbonic anhydrase/acetyltransferase-like protein (isoleucine patch superfamily)